MTGFAHSSIGSEPQIYQLLSFIRPGTYFAVLRAASQRQGDATTPFARIQYLGRVRVVVR